MRNALLAGMTLLAAVLLAACGGGGSSAGACGSTCNGCCLGSTCVTGADVTGCGSGSKNCSVCTNGQICRGGLCEAGSNVVVGDKCKANADCGALACATQVAGGGYCTADCSSAACPSGAVCVTESDGSKDCEKSCVTSADCRAEHLCFLTGATGVCRPKCTADADCDSHNCDTSTGLCGATRVGNACAADTDCGQSPAFCDKTNAAGGCSIQCGGNQQSTCPRGTNCVNSSCEKGCAQQSDCRGGFNCVTDAGGIKSCLPACVDNKSCPGAQRCNTSTGICVEGGPAAGQLGGACGGAGDCTDALGGSANCLYSYAGGYCSVNCTAQADCGSSGTCVNFNAPPTTCTDNPSLCDCLSKCSVPSDCRSAYYCYQLGGGFGGVCLAKCQSDANCASGKVCDKSGGLCVDPSTTTGTSVSRFDMTAVDGNGHALTTPVTVYTDHLDAVLTATIPADAVSATFIGQAVSDPTARVVVYRITAPDGSVLYDYGKQSSSKMKVLPSIQAGVFSVLIPNTPDVPVQAGDYSIQLLASKQTTANAFALIKHSSSQSLLAGSIDMNLFFVGLDQSNGLSAATAQTDANFKSIFNSVRDIWAQVGISIGTVKYIDLTGDDATTFRDLKEADLGTLMTRSNNPAAADNALNVFFVHSISGGSLEGYIILGESSGIPGAPVRGTTGSGLAVTTADFPNGLADIADTWAHEGSHWLGLFHTTESSGTAFDPLADTAQCPRSRDANNDGIMQPNECTPDGGADNEMFWTSVSSIAHSKLTPNQGYVLLRNPAVH